MHDLPVGQDDGKDQLRALFPPEVHRELGHAQQPLPQLQGYPEQKIGHLLPGMQGYGNHLPLQQCSRGRDDLQ